MITIRVNDKAADYASPSVRSDILRQLGYRLIVRYIDGTIQYGSPSRKDETKAEMATIIANGLANMLVWETSAARALSGAKAGALDGVLAKRDAEALGYPHGQVIIVAVDTDVIKTNSAAADAYFRAFAKACTGYACGVYGDWDTIELVKDVSVLNWQANAKGWSWDWVKNLWRGPHPRAHMLQQSQVTTAAGTIDPSICLIPFVAWDGHTVVPPPPWNPDKFEFALWPIAKKRNLKPGDQGDDVRYLQGVMRKNKQDVPNTGIFDARTLQGVNDRQRAHGFPVQPLVDQPFWKHIDSIA